MEEFLGCFWSYGCLHGRFFSPLPVWKGPVFLTRALFPGTLTLALYANPWEENSLACTTFSPVELFLCANLYPFAPSVILLFPNFLKSVMAHFFLEFLWENFFTSSSTILFFHWLCKLGALLISQETVLCSCEILLEDLLGYVGISLVQDLWDLTVFLFAADPVCSGELWLQEEQGVTEDLMSVKGAA